MNEKPIDMPTVSKDCLLRLACLRRPHDSVIKLVYCLGNLLGAHQPAFSLDLNTVWLASRVVLKESDLDLRILCMKKRSISPKFLRIFKSLSPDDVLRIGPDASELYTWMRFMIC